MTRPITLQPNHLLWPNSVPWENTKPVFYFSILNFIVATAHPWYNLYLVKAKSPHVVAGVEEGEAFAKEKSRGISSQRGINGNGPIFGQQHIVVERCRWRWYWHMEVPGSQFWRKNYFWQRLSHLSAVPLPWRTPKARSGNAPLPWLAAHFSISDFLFVCFRSLLQYDLNSNANVISNLRRNTSGWWLGQSWGGQKKFLPSAPPLLATHFKNWTP